MCRQLCEVEAKQIQLSFSLRILGKAEKRTIRQFHINDEVPRLLLYLDLPTV